MTNTPQEDLEQDYLVDELRGCVYRYCRVWDGEWKKWRLFHPEAAKFFEQAMISIGLNQPFEIRPETLQEYAERLRQDKTPPEEQK